MNSRAAEERLRALGCTLTPQRRAILRFLDGNDGHPTAADVFAAVTQDFPLASRATVYNTLALLEAAGLVRALHLGPSPTIEGGASLQARFDPNLTHHHHLVCSRCGRIQDVPGSDVQVLLRGLPARSTVRFEDLCEACGTGGRPAENGLMKS